MKRLPQHCKSTGRSTLDIRSPYVKVAYAVAFAVLGLILPVIIVYGVSMIRIAVNANRMVDSAQNLANTVSGCDSKGDFTGSVTQLTRSTRSLHRELSSPAWVFAKHHTRYGNDIDAMLAMLDSVDKISGGPLTDMVHLADRLSGMGVHDRQVDASALLALPKVVNTTRADIGTQVKVLGSVKQPRSAKVQQLLGTARTALGLVDAQLGGYRDTMRVLPQLLGAGQERTYLLMVYNPAELRSGGGMVGTVATVTAHDGKVTIGDFTSTIDYDHNVTAFDEENVREAKLFGAQVYQYAQMTTENPDFRRAAITSMNLWKRQKGNGHKNVAGVIAIDPIVLQSMLGAVGPLTLSDGTVLDGTTTAPFFLNSLYLKHPNFADQNAYVNRASGQILNHVLGDANVSNAAGLMRAIRTTSTSGHFKLWLRESGEQHALVGDKLIGKAAAGRLPGDASRPVSGIYLNQFQPSKLDWYARTAVSVRKTCGDTLASETSHLDGHISSSPKSSSLETVDSGDLGDEYTVVFTVTNTLTQQQVEGLPPFVKGEKKPGSMTYRIYLMAPLNGEITSMAYDHATFLGNMILPDRQMISLNLGAIKPGATGRIAYTVRVPRTAKSALNVVTTPVINARGIETGSNGKVTDLCPNQSRGSQGSGSQRSESSQGSDSSGDAGDGVLDRITQLRSNISCPVDIRRLAAASQ